jgi:hypothetical protein
VACVDGRRLTSSNHAASFRPRAVTQSPASGNR